MVCQVPGGGEPLDQNLEMVLHTELAQVHTVLCTYGGRVSGFFSLCVSRHFFVSMFTYGNYA
jgi:hypothetical protein